MMNNTQKAHLDMILTTSRKLLEDKYIRGALEHQSNLGEDYSVEQLGSADGSSVSSAVTPSS